MTKLSDESHVSGVAKATSLLLGSKSAVYKLSKWVAILSIMAMFLSLMTGVIVRYVLSTNLGWVSEVPNLFFPWLTMSAIVAAAAKNEHIGINLIVDNLPSAARHLVTFATNALAVTAFGVMAYYGLDVIEIAGGQRLPITKVPMSWAYWSVVIGFIALAIVSLINIALLLTGHDEHDASQVPQGEEVL
ncbi:TRAP transporter small permease [Halomonas sp. CSM-2]|uniref:TRAP transporter small permease n=1 Tax=Halomonas sp. CSM-2 TaxID=1975722 RepID=UPI000A286AE5|nr:TRAP transporter small permease [Halomonas sp. CSM-2]